MKIYIAIPAYGSQVYAEFVSSLLKLTNLFNKNKIEYSVEFMGSESLISRARNNFVARFYAESNYTHLLFLDADLIFNPDCVLKMISENKELIGSPYPKKKYNWSKIVSLVKDDKDMELSRGLMTDINYNFSKGEVNVKSTCLETKDIPTGFMLIRRSVISSLMMNYPERKYKNNIAGFDKAMDNYFYDIFGTGVVNGTYLSEDYYFCHLCREIGIKPYLETGFTFGHVGKEVFFGNLAQQLMHYEGDTMNMDYKLSVSK